jgi:hypothetical protein
MSRSSTGPSVGTVSSERRDGHVVVIAKMVLTRGRDIDYGMSAKRRPQKVMQKLGMTIQHLEEPQPLDQFVVGVLENNMP